MIVVLNTYPVIISRDLVFVSKENAIWPSTVQMGASVEALERITPETVGQVMGMIETGSLSRVSVMNANMDELYSVRNDVTGYDERVLFSLVRAAIAEKKDEFRSSFSDGAFKTYSSVPIISGGQVVGAVCVYEYDAAEGAIVLGIRNDMFTVSIALGIAAITSCTTATDAAMVVAAGLVAKRAVEKGLAGAPWVKRILDGIENVREGEYTYRVAVSGHDELAQLADEFNSLTDRLQKTEEIRRRFVADASHELKTPLAAIRLLSDSILETDNMDKETVKEFVGGIREESERLGRTTQQLLALTKLDNAVNTARVEVDCCEVAGHVLGTLKPIAERAQVRVEPVLNGGARIMATADELFQILYNLVENAIKYNRPGGSVTLTVGREAENVKIVVEDTGIGIPDADLPYIFDRFYRVEKSRDRDEGGTGLGLSIVKSTAVRHGGDVTAQRRPEGGMRFTVTFPAYVG